MSKYANPGEMRTAVEFRQIQRTHDNDGFPIEEAVNVFGPGAAVMVKWVNAHGNESFIAMQLELREPATLTMRYSPRINRELLVFRRGDPDPYEIISIDNVEQRGEWLEIKVQRLLGAR